MRKPEGKPAKENPLAAHVQLRPVAEGDLEAFFEFQTDPEGIHMAAFGTYQTDRETFDTRWAKMLGDGNIVVRTILYDGEVAGNVLKFVMLGNATVAYWIAREYWGRGIATQALSLLIGDLSERPLYARAAKDNIGSVRVLEKCGFSLVGEEKNFANAREAEIEEVIMRLDY